MENEDIRKRKEKIRREKIALRQSVPEGLVRERSEKICAAVKQTDAYRKAETVLMYHAMPGEVSLAALIEDAENSGKRIAFPRCVNKTQMEALVPESEAAYRTGAFGIREPDPDRSEQLDPKKIGLVVAPCSAFDGRCRRLGMGSGYYDRYLARCGNVPVIAAAFELQKTDEVPADEFDRPVDEVITEERIYRYP